MVNSFQISAYVSQEHCVTKSGVNTACI